MLFFVCIQCKLTLQVQSKHIKTKIKKKKKNSNQVCELEGKKKGGEMQVTKPKILFVTLFMSLLNVYNIFYFFCVYNVSLHYKYKINI